MLLVALSRDRSVGLKLMIPQYGVNDAEFTSFRVSLFNPCSMYLMLYLLYAMTFNLLVLLQAVCACMLACINVGFKPYALASNCFVPVGSHSSVLMIYLQLDGVLRSIWGILLWAIRLYKSIEQHKSIVYTLSSVHREV